MNNYFQISWTTSRSSIASAEAKTDKLSYELIDDLEGVYESSLQFKLVKITETENGLLKNESLDDLKKIWLDFQPNNLAFPLMSENLKMAINDSLTGRETIDWITTKVHYNEEHRNYYILRFNKKHDVLDKSLNLFVKGTDHVIRPTFSLSKIADLSLFTFPSANNHWKISNYIYVSEYLKTSICKHKLTGIEFSSVRVSDN